MEFNKQINYKYYLHKPSEKEITILRDNIFYKLGFIRCLYIKDLNFYCDIDSCNCNNCPFSLFKPDQLDDTPYKKNNDEKELKPKYKIDKNDLYMVFSYMILLSIMIGILLYINFI